MLDRPLRILLLEDEPSDAELIERVLRKDGLPFDVMVVDERAAFVERLEGERIDLILSDYSLPGLSGEEALRLAHQRCPEVPFVFVSGVLDEERAIELLKRGVWDWILKDHLRRLPQAVRRVLGEATVAAARARAERLMVAQNEILVSIVADTPVDLVLDDVAAMVVRLTPGAACAVLTAGEASTLDLRATAGRTGGPAAGDGLVVARQGSLSRQVAHHGHEVVLRDTEGASLCGGRGVVGGAWAVPLVGARAPGETEVFGVIEVAHPRTGHPTAMDLQVTRQGASLAALAIEHAETREQLAYIARHDPLTGVSNRMLFLEQLRGSIARSARHDELVAVLFVDVDNFKIINDTAGHAVGDRLLVAVAERLVRLVRTGDAVARLSGDEFVISCESVPSEEDAVQLAERMLGAMASPVRVDHAELYVSVSIGVAIEPARGTDPDRLVRAADVAMYRAKESGRGRVQVFNRDLERRIQLRHDVEQALRTAVNDGQLVVHYQPKVTLRTNGLAGIEALVRWDRPSHGLVLPAVFVPIAEQSNLIIDIGAFVLRQACRDAVRWHAAGRTVPLVAVNLSVRQLVRADVVGLVTETLRDTGLPADRLCLEITESLLIEEPEPVRPMLEELRRAGVRIAMDDFGTGYASLVGLRRLPIDIIKVDTSFVHGMDANAGDRAIVAAVLELAGRLGLTTVAEGVETPSQRDQLLRLGCPVAQGFLFSPALPADQLGPWLDGTRPAQPRW